MLKFDPRRIVVRKLKLEVLRKRELAILGEKVHRSGLYHSEPGFDGGITADTRPGSKHPRFHRRAREFSAAHDLIGLRVNPRFSCMQYVQNKVLLTITAERPLLSPHADGEIRNMQHPLELAFVANGTFLN